ncbi:MAG: ATP-grasp domain-containing protein [Candidatus Rokuibacteriota bacterium]
MKRIGILFGQERAFPYALIARINKLRPDAVVAEPASIGGIGLETPRDYDLVLDRISQDIPFYRAILKKFVVDGTIVVNNPFWWSADDKFFNNVVARGIGVAVPKTVILPSNHHPPDTTSASMSNLVYPLDWDGIFSHVGFPAYFKPYAGGGWKSVYRVTTPDEFFAAYRDSGQHVMTLQEEIVFEEYFRCYVIGMKHVHIMRYDPRRPHFERYVRDSLLIAPPLYERLHGDCLQLANALGYEFDTMEFAVRDGVPYAIDFLNPAPDADRNSVGPANFEWVVEHAAAWLVERVQREAEPVTRYHWQAFLAGGEELRGDRPGRGATEARDGGHTADGCGTPLPPSAGA